jgi:membrane protease YdiL (CAAX protease family)
VCARFTLYTEGRLIAERFQLLPSLMPRYNIAPSQPLPVVGTKVVERAAVMFAAIFMIGFFFGVLFRRSGNLVIVGVLHGLEDGYIDGLGTLRR